MSNRILGKAKKLLSVVLSATMVVSVLPMTSAYAQEQITRTYEYDECSITYDITEKWTNNYKVEVTVTNCGDSSIEGWAIELDSVSNITSIWDAMVYENNDETTVINNIGYNSEIPADSSVHFGYIAQGTAIIPDNASLSQLRVKSDKNISTELQVTNKWDDNFLGKIIVTNNSESDIAYWQIAFAADFNIISSDSFTFETELGDYYVIDGIYDKVIAANSSIELPFIGEMNADTATMYFDYASEIVPKYTIDENNLEQYYDINNYSNDEFPLTMHITVDENDLDFDMYNMRILGVPYWNRDNLSASIDLDINDNYSDIVDYEFLLCYNDYQQSYSADTPITDVEIDNTYYYNLTVINIDESVDLYAGSFTVTIDANNVMFILNNFAKVVQPSDIDTPMLMSAYSNLSDTDYAVSNSSTYNNESMSCALNMTYNMTSKTSISGDGLIRNSTDGDYYAFTIPANTRITATLYSPTGKNYCVYILNSSGTQVAGNTTNGNKTISATNSSSSNAVYYVLVCGYGWKNTGSSTHYSADDYYALNICTAQNSRTWFGQQEYKVGSIEYWNGEAAKKLYINNSKYFTTGWSSVTGEAVDLMESGCNITAIAMVMRNLKKSTTSNLYDFRTSYTGKLPADPYVVTLANIGSDGVITKTSSTRYDLTTSNSDPMSIASYSNIATAFGATYVSNPALSGITANKADTIMSYLNNGYSNQGVIVRTNGHSIVVFKSNTPSATNVADRFYVYDPASTQYANGTTKWSNETKYTIANATSIILFK